MASSIGSLEFFSLSFGVVNPAGEQVEDITRPFVDGTELRQLGRQGQLFTLLGVQHHATASAAKTHIEACVALVGANPQTVTDDTGETWPNIAVMRVQIQQNARRHATGVQYRSQVLLECKDTSI